MDTNWNREWTRRKNLQPQMNADLRRWGNGIMKGEMPALSKHLARRRGDCWGLLRLLSSV